MTRPPGARTPHRARRRFGQHFLHDRNVIDRIIKAIDPQPDEHFVEIGPGRGALTAPLLELTSRLDVVEIDRDLAASLRRRFDDPRFVLHEGDALRFDFTALADGDASLRVAGNLPYNISSPLLFHLLDQARALRDVHVMLQKEVVVRMCAAPGSRSYGRLTVALAARCRVERLFDIRPGSFTPPPKVDSAFVRLVPDPERRSTIRDESVFDLLVTRAFSMRRKRIANALKGIASPADLEASGIDPGQRAEQVDWTRYVRLANHRVNGAG